MHLILFVKSKILGGNTQRDAVLIYLYPLSFIMINVQVNTCSIQC